MTTDEFVKLAKTRVVQDLGLLEINANSDNLELVWFAHELGNKKCTIWGKEMGEHYAEVTYDVNKNTMYCDIYKKRIHSEEIIKSDDNNDFTKLKIGSIVRITNDTNELKRIGCPLEYAGCIGNVRFIYDGFDYDVYFKEPHLHEHIWGVSKECISKIIKY